MLSQRTAERSLVAPLWGYMGRVLDVFVYFLKRLQAAQYVFFSSQAVNKIIKISLCDKRRSISFWTQPAVSPLGVGQGQRVSMTASNKSGGSVVLKNLKKVYFLAFETDRYMLSVSRTPVANCVCIIRLGSSRYHSANTLTLQWVGAPK